jgi:PAS domain S-box-containing protein
MEQSHFKSMFDNATEGLVITDSKGNIFMVNPSACRMFGYDENELVAQKIEILIPSQYKRGHVQLSD